MEKSTVTADADMAASVLAAADSFGTDTYAFVSSDLQVLNRGLVSYAFGSVTSMALASGGTGFAATTNVVDLAGAHLGTVDTHTVVDPSGAASVSTTTFAGLALMFDLPGLDKQVAYHETVEEAAIAGTVDGNLAEFSASILAEGENTSTDLQVDALGLQDELSTVTLSATAAASSPVTYTQFMGTQRGDGIKGTKAADLVFAGEGNDMVKGRGGDDWAFGQGGNDHLKGGGGDDTLFGGSGGDRLKGGAGDDWLFGGEDCDVLKGGGGDDLLMGGNGYDILRGGAGADVLCGGADNDILFGGAGTDVFVLGMSAGDGDDLYRGGKGADIYWIVDAFDRDVVLDFSVKGGDRLAIDPYMQEHQITMRRAEGDADDLEISFMGDSGCSVLTLDEFFKANPQLMSMPGQEEFSALQVQQVLDLIGADPLSPVLADAQANYTFGDMLSLLG